MGKSISCDHPKGSTLLIDSVGRQLFDLLVVRDDGELGGNDSVDLVDAANGDNLVRDIRRTCDVRRRDGGRGRIPDDLEDLAVGAGDIWDGH